ncbi:hypothetical protein K440DRAFT_642242 [Wilcoxina mikolae CBS 423.85]|nr:hypothetical protein K440DRAFT_642242 [Wilcoxina mikolae CBS 423.85]
MLEIIHVGLSESLEQVDKFTKICNLNDSLATKVKDLETAVPVQDGTSKEWVVVHQEIHQLKDELRIEKRYSVKLERWLDKCKSEPEPTEQTDVKQLQLEKYMILYQAKNLLSDKY